MKLAARSAAALALSVSALTSIASAHPGHDGHELTWDFRHLAAHPAATAMWAVLLIAGAWFGARLAAAIVRAVRR